jgi:hypothetical protein
MPTKYLLYGAIALIGLIILGVSPRTFIALALAAIGFVVYFLPSLIAGSRKHKNYMPVFCLNLFLGWTGLGWIGALCWSFTDQGDTKSSKA